MNLGKRYDFHSHTIFSDGELIPSELVRRAKTLDHKAIALTDHVDASNIEFIVPNIAKVSEELNQYWDIMVIPGVEITHVPPETIKKLAIKAKKLGAKIVVVHGETPVEPVMLGTNRSAIESGEVDILAHPGIIDEKDAKLANKSDIFLEITARSGHNIGNGRVAALGENFLLNTDTHSPNNLITQEFAYKVALGAGLNEESSINVIKENPKVLLEKIL
ncbi:MAG TPA: histidinol phosphate phosphatase domain-containing protein [Methanofastidiosum sp.]|jgi:putative hydrolase|nr:histidinol phosphate phosphatase domain-containing protein [Methanofastidiosum sp.]HNV94057.1 histidinol phosphate phosphatase domain-containing protein [Methanofastidiosum sp.]HNZ60461.1 histidinol phosphate phosphatase domain-containing protein [Methanofastidiosum sp.]HOT84275.1 histidinol phosphate phosphatase domain-containing protein [Methanofastidiosum sp.]HPU90839.1 histidinol phosphate phosphatase domain-containing protein [Methanofastidiosum sp.]